MDNSIIDKIRKCLELAKRGGTEGEANAAMSRVQELLIKYNLSLSEIEGHTSIDDAITRIDSKANYRPWERQIWHGVAKLYFCGMFQSRGKVVLIGPKSSLPIVTNIAKYLIGLGETLAKQTGGDTTFKTSFKNGFGSRISARCFDEIRKAKAGQINDDTGKALILHPMYDKADKAVSTYLRNQGIRTHASRSGSRSRNCEGYNAGKQAGNSASLGRNEIAGKSNLRLN